MIHSTLLRTRSESSPNPVGTIPSRFLYVRPCAVRQNCVVNRLSQMNRLWHILYLVGLCFRYTGVSPCAERFTVRIFNEEFCPQVSTVLLYGVPIVSLVIEGNERLCLAQISNTLLKQFSYNEIHNRRVALGITCVQCTPVQLEILRRAGAMPVSSRRCGETKHNMSSSFSAYRYTHLLFIEVVTALDSRTLLMDGPSPFGPSCCILFPLQKCSKLHLSCFFRSSL
jgi:hypothetical protein